MSHVILKGKSITWFHFPHLEEKDFDILEREFKFHPLDFDDLRNASELPKIDVYKHYLFAMLAIPAYRKGEDRVQKADLALFIGGDHVVTVAREPVEAVDRFLARAKRSTRLRQEIFSETSGHFLYRLLDYVYRDSKVVLHELARQTQDIEKEVYEHHGKGTTRHLGVLRRNLLFLRHMIDPQRIIVEQFMTAQKLFLPQTLAVYYDDLKDTLEGMWVVTDNLKSIVDSLFDVNEAFLSHRTNEIIRLLTIISVVLMPPTLITSYYGMNVANLPLAHDIQSVTFMILMSLVVFLVIIMIMDKRR